MTGLVEADTLMTRSLTLNYTEAECDGPLFGKTNVRGHEFHYSSIQNVADDSKFSYSMKRGKGVTGSHDGFIINDSSALQHICISILQTANYLIGWCSPVPDIHADDLFTLC